MLVLLIITYYFNNINFRNLLFSGICWHFLKVECYFFWLSIHLYVSFFVKSLSNLRSSTTCDDFIIFNDHLRDRCSQISLSYNFWNWPFEMEQMSKKFKSWLLTWCQKLYGNFWLFIDSKVKFEFELVIL